MVLHDLTNAVPFAPRSFISNDGTTFAPSSSQQHRRLSVAIPSQLQDGGGVAAAGGLLQSPVGGMMATLLAEAATSHMNTAQTPWSVHPAMDLLSPSSSAVLDANALAAQQVAPTPGMENSTAALAAIGSPSAGATSDRLAALLQWQNTIEAAEAQWGPLHPAVGRAWLELARALQAVDKDSERAKLATKKAFDICQILLKETATVDVV
ncbi:hypothetical protein OEZ85_011967 [Tetradesmus obliquus]|uniref:Uncharacterized protein n=1 Tax=Tetradesmus obliquus TaxID=3088 RepID=A0ABY8TU88_TETOB|nr:hypothetical protein OEZ85_011967 [Tetradesmus obliquus]